MSPSEWLDSQGRFGGPRGASGERLTHRAGDKFFHLRRGAASEPRHIHRLHEIEACKERVGGEPLDQIVVMPLAHLGGGGMAVAAERLVEFLPVTARLRGGHQQSLAGEEGKVMLQIAADGTCLLYTSDAADE